MWRKIIVGIVRKCFLVLMAFTVIVGWNSPVSAEVEFWKYELGISPQSLHDRLVGDKFVFKVFSDRKIVAIKRVAIVPNEVGEEISEIVESTRLTATICSNKVKKLDVQSVYSFNQSKLFAARKKFYEYLNENKALPTKNAIRPNKNAKSSSVTLEFEIDRNNQGRSDIRGIETAKVSIFESLRLNVNDVPALEMRYVIENTWFCPN